VRVDGRRPGRVYQWTPNASGTATIQTCGAGTNFDTVLYTATAVGHGSELPGGCNDDASPTRPAFSELAPHPDGDGGGRPNFIIVDGYSTSSGSFTLSVTPRVLTLGSATNWHGARTFRP